MVMKSQQALSWPLLHHLILLLLRLCLLCAVYFTFECIRFIHGWCPIVKTLVSITTIWCCCWSVEQIFYLETTWTIIIEQCLYYGCSRWQKLSLLCMHIQLQNCLTFTIKQTSNMRNYLMNNLHGSHFHPLYRTTLPTIPWCPFFSLRFAHSW